MKPPAQPGSPLSLTPSRELADIGIEQTPLLRGRPPLSTRTQTPPSSNSNCTRTKGSIVVCVPNCLLGLVAARPRPARKELVLQQIKLHMSPCAGRSHFRPLPENGMGKLPQAVHPKATEFPANHKTQIPDGCGPKLGSRTLTKLLRLSIASTKPHEHDSGY